MSAAARQLAQLRDLIDGPCQLPLTALGIVGIPACARYDSHRGEAWTKVRALQTEAEALADGLARNAVGYISAEAANLRAIEEAAAAEGVADTGSGGRGAEAAMAGVTFAAWPARSLLGRGMSGRLAAARAEASSASAELDGALRTATKLWQADSGATRLFMSPEGVSEVKLYGDINPGQVDRAVLGAIEKQVSAVDRVSVIAALSQKTETVLRGTGPFSVAAFAASALWTANAVVMSDDLIDKAIRYWRGVAAGARTMFSEWMPAIRRSLFPDWTGTASTAAERRFASFVADGTALADRAEHLAASLTTGVQRLNQTYWVAFAFAQVQFLAMIAVAVTAWYNPAAAAVLQYLGYMLQTSVTVALNAILAVLGGLGAWMAV